MNPVRNIPIGQPVSNGVKRLLFLTTFDYPSRYAHAIHGLHMVRAFYKELGENFLFFVNTVVDDTLSGIPYRRAFGRYGRLVKKLRLRRVLMPFVLRRFFAHNPDWRGAGTALLINDPRLIALAARATRRFGVRFVFESHGLLAPALLRLLAEHAERVFFVTPFLEQSALHAESALKGKTVVLPNAVDMSAFMRVPDDSSALRKELMLPDGFLVGYFGRFMPLHEDKGLSLMIDALVELPPSVRLLLVGGTREEVAHYQGYAKARGVEGRVTLIPHVSTDLVPRYEKACDVLAYVPAGGSAYFEQETSPMKLFEYMAAGRPMVLSDLPTVQAVVPADAAYFVTRGAPSAFVEAIQAIQKNGAEASLRAHRALAQVRENTWEARARRILEASSHS